MSNKNDMKLIMEEWRKSMQERVDLVSPSMTPDISTKDVAAARAQAAEPNYYERLKKFRKDNEDSFLNWWTLVDFLDPTGITDYPAVGEAYDRYMEWYDLPPGHINKTEEEGSARFAEFVINVIFAVPAVDLVGALATGGASVVASGAKAALKDFLKEVAVIATVYLGAANTDFHSKLIEIEELISKLEDMNRFKGRRKVGVDPSKKGGFEAIQQLPNAEYFPPQKK